MTFFLWWRSTLWEVVPKKVSVALPLHSQVLLHSIRSIAVVNTLRLRQNCYHFGDDILKYILLIETASISLKILLTFVPKIRINNILALVQMMPWRRPGDKLLSEPMMVSILTHICISRSQCGHEWMWSQNDKTSSMKLHGLISREQLSSLYHYWLWPKYPQKYFPAHGCCLWPPSRTHLIRFSLLGSLEYHFISDCI